MNGDGMGLSWVWLLLILGVAIRVWWLVRASSTPGSGPRRTVGTRRCTARSRWRS